MSGRHAFAGRGHAACFRGTANGDQEAWRGVAVHVGSHGASGRGCTFVGPLARLLWTRRGRRIIPPARVRVAAFRYFLSPFRSAISFSSFSISGVFAASPGFFASRALPVMCASPTAKPPG